MQHLLSVAAAASRSAPCFLLRLQGLSEKGSDPALTAILLCNRAHAESILGAPAACAGSKQPGYRLIALVLRSCLHVQRVEDLDMLLIPSNGTKERRSAHRPCKSKPLCPPPLAACFHVCRHLPCVQALACSKLTAAEAACRFRLIRRRPPPLSHHHPEGNWRKALQDAVDALAVDETNVKVRG